MKSSNNSLLDVKNQIYALLGKRVSVSINQGRGKFKDYVATVKYVYPSVFVLCFDDEGKQKTFSYNDMLCGQVKFL